MDRSDPFFIKISVTNMKLIAHFLALMLLAPALQAELATGTAAGSATGTAGRAALGGNSFSSELDKASGLAGDSNSGKGVGDAALLKEHLSEQERLDRVAAEKARIAARLNPADEALKRKLEAEKLKSAGAKDTPETWVDSALAPLKEAVKPIKESLDQLTKKDGEADTALHLPKMQEPILVVVPEEQKRRSQSVSTILWEQFVEDVKPWAIGGAVLLVLGLGLAQFLAKSGGGPSRSTPTSRSPVKGRRRGGS